MTKPRSFLAILSTLMIAALSMSAYASNFGFDVFIDSTDTASLMFGLRAPAQKNDILPAVPDFELVDMCKISFGAFADAGSGSAKDYTALSFAVLPADADKVSKTWTLNVSEFKPGASSVTLKFNVNDIGAIPAKSSLYFGKEVGTSGTSIKDGTSIKIDELGTYYITYICPNGKANLPTPPSFLNEQGSYGQLYTLPLDKAASYGFGNITAFEQKTATIEGNEYTYLSPLDLVLNVKSDYTIQLPNDITAKAVYINYFCADAKGTALSDSGLIAISLVNGIAAKPLKNLITFNDEVKSDSLVYALHATAATKANITLDITVPTAQSSTPYAIKYAFASSASATPDKALTFTNEGNGVVTAAIPTIDVPQGDSYLVLSVDAYDDAFSSALYATIDSNNGENKLDKVVIRVLNGSVSLDFDGNGEVALDDAIMFYNFMALGGINNTRIRAAQLLSFTSGAVAADAEVALQYFKDNYDKLDFDGNGTTHLDDAIMFYNFMALGGVNNTRIRAAQLLSFTTGAVADDAAIALEFFKANAK